MPLRQRFGAGLSLTPQPTFYYREASQPLTHAEDVYVSIVVRNQTMKVLSNQVGNQVRLKEMLSR